MNNSSSGPDNDERVVDFRRPNAPPRGHRPPPAPPVEDLTKYARSEEAPDDYRHRMKVNAVAFLFVVLLIGAAIWMADVIATMKKNQDCVLSGRRGCNPIVHAPPQV